MLKELLRRRVPQILGIYLASAWGLVQFVDWLVERYLLSPYLTEALLLALASLLPAVALLAWSHGAQGRQQISRATKIAVPTNGVLSLILLGTLLHGKDLGATATTVTVTDEEGTEVTRLVPRANHRYKMALFFWANDSGDSDLDWLRYGLPTMLGYDLQQNRFLDIWTPYRGSFVAPLERAGYEDGLDVPLALARRTAESYRLASFVDGRFDRQGDLWRLSIKRYDTASAEMLDQQEVEGPELTKLVDELSRRLITETGVPANNERLGSSLPIAEQLSSDLEAVRAWVEGGTAMLFGHQLEAASQHFRRAVEIDPAFALAQSQLSTVLLLNGESTAADQAMRAALRHDYRLPETEKFRIKGTRYLIENQADKRLKLYEMWVELYPDDVTALIELAEIYPQTGNRLAEAKATYERILEVDPNEIWALTQIAHLAVALGDEEGARAALERRVEADPDSHFPVVNMAWFEAHRGNLEVARTGFERAAMMASGFVDPILALAEMALRAGDLEEAARRLDEAQEIAVDARQQAGVLDMKISHLRHRGRLREAFPLLAELRQARQQYQSPIDVAIGVDSFYSDLHAAADNGKDLRSRFDVLREQLGQPFADFLSIGYAFIALWNGEAQQSERHLNIFEGALNRWEREDMRSLTAFIRGLLYQLQEKPTAAVSELAQAAELYQSSLMSATTDQNLLFGIWIKLAQAQREADDPAAARSTLAEILRLFPAEPNSHLEMARLEQAEGRTDEARQHLQQALAVWRDADPDFLPANEAKALLADLGTDG